MKKILLLLFIIMSAGQVQAQVEGEVNAVALDPAGNRTYVDLIRELFENISPKQLGGGWAAAQTEWQNNKQNKNTIKQQALFLDLLATHLTTNSFRPEWNSISKQWKTEIKTCTTVPSLCALILQLESSLTDEVLLKSWKSVQMNWRGALEKKIKG